MDVINALRTLRRHWKWAAIGLLPAAYIALSIAYHVGLSGIHRKSLDYGAAQTQLLIDSPQSTLASAGADVTPLATRAQVFAEFYQTGPVKTEMANLLHVQPGAIAVTIPNTNLAPEQIIPTAGQSNSAIMQGGDALQLEVVSESNLPMISLYAQGPNGAAAAALANSAAQALSDYVASLKPFTPTSRQLAQESQLGIMPPSRVTVRQLGTAQGAMVDSGASRVISALAFIGLGVLDCMLVITIAGFVERWRTGREIERGSVNSIGLDTPHARAHSLPEPADFDTPLLAARE